MADGSHTTQPTNQEVSDPRTLLNIPPRPHNSGPPIFATIEERECEEIMKTFVNTFVVEFEKYLQAKYLVLKGEMKDGETRSVGDTGMTLSELVCRGVGGILGKLLISSEKGLNVGGVVGQKVDEAWHKKKLHNLAPLIKHNICNYEFYSDVKKILVECGFHMFRIYENQAMRVTTPAVSPLAVEKLAQDAVHRTINYCAENRIKDVTVDHMTRGVVEGKSKKENYYSPKRGLSITYNDVDVTTGGIFSKPGLVELNNDGKAEKYFKKLDGTDNTSKYGHRVPFNWEYSGSGDIYTVLKDKYQRDEKPQNEYTYIVWQKNTDSVLEKLLSDILSADQQLQQRRMRELVITAADAAMCEITEEMIDSLVTQLMEEQERKRKRKPPFDSRKSIGPREDAIIFELSKPVKGFTGREEPLCKLVDLLSNQNDSKMVIVCGEQGVGKSELVRKYVSEHYWEYNNCVWINAESAETMQSSFISLASKLGIKTDNTKLGVRADILDAVYQKLLLKKSLLIFDNAKQFSSESEEDDGLDNFLPTGRAKKLHVIITSRHVDWDSLIPTIQLGRLS